MNPISTRHQCCEKEGVCSTLLSLLESDLTARKDAAEVDDEVGLNVTLHQGKHAQAFARRQQINEPFDQGEAGSGGWVPRARAHTQTNLSHQISSHHRHHITPHALGHAGDVEAKFGDSRKPRYRAEAVVRHAGVAGQIQAPESRQRETEALHG